MGEWKVPVAVKLETELVQRMDLDVTRFSPFCEGRGTIARVLIQLAYAAIDKGILQYDLPSIQALLSNPRAASTPGLHELHGAPGLVGAATKRNPREVAAALSADAQARSSRARR